MDGVAAATPFVGRERELARLEDLLRGAAAGRPAGVLLAGDAGVGKTRLITEVIRRATGAGVLVLTGHCVDLGTGALPYLPFADAFSRLARAAEDSGADPTAAAGGLVLRAAADRRPHLARLVGRGAEPDGERVPGDAGMERLAMFDAVGGSLADLAADVAPVLLVLEDLHWADASTRDLVRFLLARLGTERLVILASYRSDDLHRRHPLRPLLAELVRLPTVERIEVAPFAGAELAAFVRAVRSGVPESEIANIGARSAGNAYFAEELLACGDGTCAGLPTALADVLLDRLDRLEPGTQHLVRVASVIGSARIDDGLLHAAAVATGNARPADAEHEVADAVAHQVLVPDGDGFAFRHALLQEALYGDLLPMERVRIHAALSRLLADRGPEWAGEQARHALAAHDLPGALGASVRAGTEAHRRAAPAEALAHREQALQLWEAVPAADRPAGVTLDELNLTAAAAAADVGEDQRASALATAAREEAERSGDPERIARARSRLAVHVYATERLLDARDEARRAIEALPAGSSSTAGIWAASIEARVELSLGDPDAVHAVVEPAMAEARRLGDLAAEADLLISRSAANALQCRPEQAMADLTLAGHVAERSGDPVIRLRAGYTRGLNLVDLGNLRAGLAQFRDCLAAARRGGIVSSLYGVQTYWQIAQVQYVSGDWGGVADTVSAARRELTAAGAAEIGLIGLQVGAARDPATTLPVLDLALAGSSAYVRPSALRVRAEALGWLGDPAGAAAAMEEALDAINSAERWSLFGIMLVAIWLGALADLAAAERERGEPVAAAAVAARAAELFASEAEQRARLGQPRLGTLGPEGIAWLLRAEAERGRAAGDPDPGPWVRTAEAFDASGEPYEAARARFRLAAVLLARGDRDAAAVELDRAHRAADRLDAVPLRTAVEDLARRGRVDLARANGGSGRAAGRPGVQDGLVPLTPREREVIRLVADGLTNRQVGERLFISEKTASVHVSNLLAKLNASGRAEAVAIAARQGLLPGSGAAP